jgi:hypothetical protein
MARSLCVSEGIVVPPHICQSYYTGIRQGGVTRSPAGRRFQPFRSWTFRLLAFHCRPLTFNFRWSIFSAERIHGMKPPLPWRPADREPKMEILDKL